MPATTTHPTLLDRLRDPADHAAWHEFADRYGDLILRYCLKSGLQYADAEDVRQRVMLSLAQAMPGFQYQPRRGRFRSYLGQVVRHAIHAFLKARRPDQRPSALSIDDTATAAANDGDGVWDGEWVSHHYRLALRALRASFEPQSIAIFDHLLSGATIRETAGAFDMTVEAVQKVKQRVRDRLRDVIAEQIRQEESSH
jgi:RNA polymerase sigma factor (sigma-70 family)